MPRIPDNVLDTTFYLYRTVEDAKTGANPGGTGFLVGVPSHKFPNVYRTPGADLVKERNHFAAKALEEGITLFGLLGIHWGQFPEKWPLKKGELPKVEESAEMITDGIHVEGVSGMTCVLPSRTILEVLCVPDLDKERAVREAAIEEKWRKIKSETPAPKAEAEDGPAATAENPQHKEDFASPLKKAATTTKTE